MTDPTMSEHRPLVERLCAEAFGRDTVSVTDLSDVNRGRGVFSVVLRARLAWHRSPTSMRQPATVVAKLPKSGPNGEAAITTGAYRREALAYRELLDGLTVSVPHVYAIEEPGDGSCALLLEDLSGHRAVDQLDGLGAIDTIGVAEMLAAFHAAWRNDNRLATLSVRRNTVATLPRERLTAGLECLERRWAEDLGPEHRQVFAALLASADGVINRFGSAVPTLCHGDPRADNLVFDTNGAPVLFDWQQMAVQFGEADLAWLAATSIEPTARRALDDELVRAYGGDFDRYRLGMALPAMTVLLLAQRDLPSVRARRFVAVRLLRIATAVADLDVASFG